MSTGKILFITLLAGLISIGAGVLGHRYLGPAVTGTPQSGNANPATSLTSLPEFTLPDLQGKDRNSSQWAGKLLVLNFWATWCPPCRREIPDFIALQQEFGERGLQFVGIAIDQADKVREFAAAEGINYPILLGDENSIEMSRRLGNRLQGLPFSALFDRTGRVIHVQAGELKPDTVREKLLALP